MNRGANDCTSSSMNVSFSGGDTITMTITGAGVYRVNLGPDSAQLRAEVEEFSHLTDGYRGEVGAAHVQIVRGVVTMTCGAASVEFPIAAVPRLGQELRIFAAGLAQTTPPRAGEFSGGQWPQCVRCGREMRFDYRDPFDDRWYQCAGCLTRYCDHGGMYDITE
jgi:hypothetical protein